MIASAVEWMSAAIRVDSLDTRTVSLQFINTHSTIEFLRKKQRK